MTETEKLLVEIFSKVIPTMTEQEKARLLGFGEGMAFMSGQRAQQVQRREGSSAVQVSA